MAKVSQKRVANKVKNDAKPNPYDATLASQFEKELKKLSEYLQQIKNAQVDISKLSKQERREYLKHQEDIKKQQKDAIERQKLLNSYEKASLFDKQKILSDLISSYDKEISKLKDLQNISKLTDEQTARLTELTQRKITIQKQRTNVINALENPDERNSFGARISSIKYRTEKALKGKEGSTQEAIVNALEQYGADKEDEEGKEKEIKGSDAMSSLSNVLPGKLGMIAGGIGKALKVFEGISDTIGKIKGILDDQVEEAISALASFQGSVDARLQGLDINFLKLVDNFNSKFTTQGLIKATDYLENISDLTQQGVVYNLEQRALISSIGDRLVSTFEVANENLLRLIRLQQADMTYSQAGAEAQLTQLLNSVFQDTSYLTDMYDSVSAALIDASSTMTRDQATSFNYAVQKWLGALYSVGLSQSAVDTIAQGINYLATGDVSALTGNPQLNTLMAMSASRAGLSYSQMLSTGLTFENVDSLMTAMVQYLQDIANNTSNQVTKQAFTDVLNLTMSDLRAVSNLQVTDIAALQNSNVTYSSSMSQFENQLNQLSGRTNIATQIDNMIDNILFNFGTNITDDAWQLGAWKISKLLDNIKETFDVSGGIGGFIMDSISGLLSGGSMIWGLLETLWDVGSSGLGNFIGKSDAESFMALLSNDWEYTRRGGIYAGIDESAAAKAQGGPLDSLISSITDVMTGVSESISISNSAVKNSATEQDMLSFEQYANATTVSSVTRGSSDSVRVERTVGDIYAQLFENKQQVRVSVASIESQARESITNAVTYSIDNGEEDSLVQTTRDIKKFLEDNVSTENITSILSNTIVNVRKQ